MIDELRYIKLLKKYLDDHINESELNELFTLNEGKNSEEILGKMISKDLATDLSGGQDLPFEIKEEIFRKILTSEKNTNKIFILNNRKKVLQILSVAAMILVIFFVSIYLNSLRSNKANTVTFLTSIPTNNIKKVNNSSQPFDVVLEDGSTVKLSPNSSLSFPEHFHNEKREVYLTGEGFFEVTKNPQKPFLVYYNNIVTKVLGTSFKIKTNDTNKNVEVTVITGRVQVFENRNVVSADDKDKNIKNVILVPNQKALYNTTLHNFETTLADSIHALVKIKDIENSLENESAPQSFIFEKATSVKQIFTQLSKLYGVEIIVANDNIYNCFFTGDISTQGMFEKLKIVSITIGASYEIKGTKILVSGKGCR